ncbi:PREDICTED: EPIDERMAL PATTERNING FACTOR-like protein 4 [Lupinus angustifolius]|uniref:EPIDERMAL PATTERNING FACTOR-like protein 4 n=1 Tax=Lupinus angustifolius TaxID=3871 RepID=UPI00092E63F6|nr:PREDICTED: EPIDERMAL PATTERNING FACTOR-like protein 4 [Lupinus angustifolius]
MRYIASKLKTKPFLIPTILHILTPCNNKNIYRLMDSHSPKVYSNGLKTSLALILIISLTLFPSNSVSASTKDGKGLIMKQNKLVLGSRPPRCVNKCLNCKPCMATLVISPHHKDVHIHKAKAQRDEGYYLLSWKCKCGNKFFQP